MATAHGAESWGNVRRAARRRAHAGALYDRASWRALLVALAIWPSRHAHAHEAVEPPKPIEVVDGAWPPGPPATHDVVVPMLVIVTEQGEVRDPTIDVSLGEQLDAAALRAAQRWRFEPARRAGVPIASRARIAVRFRTPKDAPPPPAATPAPSLAQSVDAAVASTEAAQHAGIPPALLVGPLGAAGPEDDISSGTPFQAVAHAARPPRSASETTRDRLTLAAAPHRTGDDMLRVLPGVFVSQHGGEGKASQIFYRGFDADHGQDLEIWAGGAPVNDVSNIHGQGYADLHFLIPEVVRAIRLTPGTYDPRQGDFAVAGTVRFELGYDQPGLMAKAAYGSFRTTRYFLAYRPRNTGEGTFAAAEFYRTDGFGPSRAAQRASAIAQGSWQLDDGLDVRLLLTAYTGHFDTAGVLRLSDVESGVVSRYATYDPSQGGASMRTQLVAELKHKTSVGCLTVAPYFVMRSMRLRQNFTGYLTDPSGDSQQQLHEGLVLGGTASYSLRTPLFSPSDRLEIGVAARTDWIAQSQKRISTVDGAVTSDEVDAKVRALDIAGYVDAALHPFSWLTLRGGLRIDGLSYLVEDRGAAASGQARASQGAHFGKKATIELKLLSGLSLLGSYGEGFRSPQARNLAESESTPFTRVRSLEVGLRYTSGLLSASAAGFRTTLSDDLVFNQATARNDVVPATVRTGGTVDATLRPLHWLSLTVNATYTRASFRERGGAYAEGDLVPYAPQLVTRADLAATPVLASWRGRKLQTQLGAGISYMARRPLPYARVGHDIFLVDGLASVRWGEVALSLRAFNLLGARWYDGEFTYASDWSPGQGGASLVPMRHVTIGAPRTLLGALEIYL